MHLCWSVHNGSRVPPDKLPTEAGVLMLDAPAAMAVGRCLLHDESMRQVPVGIYEESNGRGHLFWVPVGTKLSDVLAAAEVAGESTELWAGHVLRHVPIDRAAIVGTGELTVFASTPRRPEAPSACLGLWLVRGSLPGEHPPAGLLDAAQQNDPQIAEQYGLRSASTAAFAATFALRRCRCLDRFGRCGDGEDSTFRTVRQMWYNPLQA